MSKIDTAVMQFGSVQLLNVPHAAAVAQEIFEEDCYDFERVPADSVVIDVGAFYGEFSLRCRIEKNCHVFSYEPCPLNRRIFELNCRLNGVREDGVSISDRAIGKPGVRAFLSWTKHPAGSLFAAEAIRQGLVGTVLNVTVVSLGDEIAQIRRAFPQTPICVKMDCEGAEREIFTDTTWLDQVTNVLMEWHNYDGDVYRSILEPRGFEVKLEGGGPRPRPAWDETIGGGLLLARRR